MNKSPLYHGTKSNFKKFDLSFVNTGNQLQKYGYGIYLTSNPEVAENYRKNSCISDDCYESYLVKNDYDSFIVDETNKDEYDLVSAIYDLDFDVLESEIEDEDSEYFENKYMRDNLDRFRDMEISSHQGAIYKVALIDDVNILNGEDCPDSLMLFNILQKIIPEKKLDKAEQYVLDCFDGNTSLFNSFFYELVTMNHSGNVEYKIQDLAPNLDSNHLIELIEPYYFEAYSEDYSNKDLYDILSSMLGTDKLASQVLNSVGYSGMYIKNPTKVLSSNKNHKEDCLVVWDEDVLRIQEKIIDLDSEIDFSPEESDSFEF